MKINRLKNIEDAIVFADDTSRTRLTTVLTILRELEKLDENDAITALAMSLSYTAASCVKNRPEHVLDTFMTPIHHIVAALVIIQEKTEGKPSSNDKDQRSTSDRPRLYRSRGPAD